MNAELPQPEFTPVQWIQIMYPSEPNWDEVTDETLVGLVEAFEGELSCAGAGAWVLGTAQTQAGGGTASLVDCA